MLFEPFSDSAKTQDLDSMIEVNYKEILISQKCQNIDSERSLDLENTKKTIGKLPEYMTRSTIGSFFSQVC